MRSNDMKKMTKIMIVICLLFIAFALGNIFQIFIWHKLLVDKGLAEHNPKTGAWQLKEKVVLNVLTIDDKE